MYVLISNITCYEFAFDVAVQYGILACTICLRMERGSLLIELPRTGLHDSSKFMETI